MPWIGLTRHVVKTLLFRFIDRGESTARPTFIWVRRSQKTRPLEARDGSNVTGASSTNPQTSQKGASVAKGRSSYSRVHNRRCVCYKHGLLARRTQIVWRVMTRIFNEWAFLPFIIRVFYDRFSMAYARVASETWLCTYCMSLVLMWEDCLQSLTTYYVHESMHCQMYELYLTI